MDIYRAYETEKTNRNEIDFDDILLITCHLIESDEDVAASIRSGITWLTVDEYQDVSPLQHRLLTRWLGDNRNICVVGDPAQTIYSFAGASSYNLLNFASEFGPLTADVRLNNDYRSTPQIVNYANRVLEASPQRADYLKLNSKRDRLQQRSRRSPGRGCTHPQTRGRGSISGRLRHPHPSQRAAENPLPGTGRTTPALPRQTRQRMAELRARG